jgi:uncharacterized protein
MSITIIYGENIMIKCPHCEVVMNEVRKLEINIDVCPKCMGVWLDKGELEKTIELDIKEESYKKPDEYKYKENHDIHHDDDDYDDDHNKHGNNQKIYYDKNGNPRKRRGGISEIFGDLFG